MHPDGSGLDQLTNSPALDALPAFSPDGTKIVFVSDRAAKDSRKLFVMSADGGTATRLINLSGFTYQMVPDWQPLAAKDPCTIRGTINADQLVGTPGADVICGLGGNDSIQGLGGNDKIDGGAGNDLITGGAGTDTLLGGNGNDTIYAKDGARDLVNGGPGADTAVVDPKLDRLVSIERHNKR
jgi:Ca2+-binding RTX toxin-like protein